jgi:hypothetical protein
MKSAYAIVTLGEISASSSLCSIKFSKMHLKDLMYMLERFKQHFKVERANQSSICNNKAIT